MCSFGISHPIHPVLSGFPRSDPKIWPFLAESTNICPNTIILSSFFLSGPCPSRLHSTRAFHETLTPPNFLRLRCRSLQTVTVILRQFVEPAMTVDGYTVHRQKSTREIQKGCRTHSCRHTGSLTPALGPRSKALNLIDLIEQTDLVVPIGLIILVPSAAVFDGESKLSHIGMFQSQAVRMPIPALEANLLHEKMHRGHGRCEAFPAVQIEGP